MVILSLGDKETYARHQGIASILQGHLSTDRESSLQTFLLPAGVSTWVSNPDPDGHWTQQK